jgi:hypothetical protein
MGRGLHTWIAASLMSVGVILGLMAQTITVTVLFIVFLAAAIGLLGEVPRLVRKGEVRARLSGHSMPNRFLVIRKADSPVRFHFYVLTYTVLGGFSLVTALFVFLGLVTRHGG